MENPGKTASRALARSSEFTEQPREHSSTTERRSAAVWRAMAELYGPAFAAAYGDTPSPLWSRAIAELTDTQCRDGLTRLAREARDYPANLTQFVAACLPNKSGSPRYLGVPITDEQRADLYLPKPQVSREKIDGYLAKMRAKVSA
jgi:hypothetical protein